MTEIVGKREAETALWEHYKPFLQFLFIDQNRTLKEVRNIMAQGCAFDRKCVTSLGRNEKLRLVSQIPGCTNMKSGSGIGNFAKTSLGRSGGKQSLSWTNESSMESHLLL
jgi:hypothetical protein